MRSIIVSGDLRGHGTVSSCGGKGDGNAGGGGGGRVALHSLYDTQFRGSLLVNGNKGTNGGDIGGPGTIFMEDTLIWNEKWENRLYVDGKDANQLKPCIIYERNPRVVRLNLTNDNNADVSFDHVLLKNKASIKQTCVWKTFTKMRRLVQFPFDVLFC